MRSRPRRPPHRLAIRGLAAAALLAAFLAGPGRPAGAGASPVASSLPTARAASGPVPLGAAAGPVPAPASSPIHDVSATPRLAEGEESVAVNPLDPSDIVVGSNQFAPLTPGSGDVPEGGSGSQQAAVWASRDGGATWTGGTVLGGGVGPVAVPGALQPKLGREVSDAGNVIGSDQSVVFDRHGVAYYESIRFGLGPGSRADVKVPVQRSVDGGRTWSAPVIAFDQNATHIDIDRPFLAVDDSGGPRDGTLYLGFETQFYAPYPNAVYVRSSRDGGRTWGAITRVDGAACPAMWDPREYPVVGADGTLFVVYDSARTATPLPDDPGSKDVRLCVARSTDGGATFHLSVVEPHAHRLSDPYEAIPAVEELITAVAVDPLDPRRVAVAWPDGRTGEGRILLRTSDDGGITWSGAVDVADDPRGTGNEHDHVALAWLPDGRLGVVWRDRRYGGGAFGDDADIFARALDVSGPAVPAGPVIRLTDRSQPPTTVPTGIQPSEYLAAAAGPEGLTVSWDQMAGRLPDDVERRVPVAAFDAAGGIAAAEGATQALAVPAAAAGGGLPGTSDPGGAPAPWLPAAALLAAASVLRRARRSSCQRQR